MTQLTNLAERIQLQIGREIGYVSQQVACNWAVNNARSIAECLGSAPHKKDLLHKNIAELFINSLCIADQYYINLPRAYSKRKIATVIEDAIDSSYGAENLPALDEQAKSIVSAVVSIAGVLAHYHGWEASEQRPQPLVGHIINLHITIYSICKRLGINLHKHVVEVIETARHRTPLTLDSERYDPVTSPVLMAFSKIKEKSVCTFAKPSKAWGARRYRDEQSIEVNLNESLDVLSRLSRCGYNEDVDALLIMLPGSFSRTLDELASTLNRTLWFFGYNDPSGSNSLEQVGETKWRFKFLHMPYFVQTFGTCYDSSNTRFTQGIDATFIQFVTEAAFHRTIPREERHSSSVAIREYASETGRSYDVQHHDSNAFVHNLRSGMKPVKWFKPIERSGD